MNELRLEAGKRYKMRNGEIVTIERSLSFTAKKWPFTPVEVDSVIANPPYPETPETFGNDAELDYRPQLYFTLEEYTEALKFLGIKVNRTEAFYKLVQVMQRTGGNPTMREMAEVLNEST